MHAWLIFIHILSATIWTGGHLILSLVILPKALIKNDPEIIKSFEASFEKLGILALIFQVLTGLHMAAVLIKPSQWFAFSNPAEAAIGLKLIFLGILILTAIHGRLLVFPKMQPGKMKLMAGHILFVTLISVLMVLFGVSYRTGGMWPLSLFGS
jgi:putative copper export protein